MQNHPIENFKSRSLSRLVVPPSGARGLAIIDYQAGNITSVKNTLDRLGYHSVITNDAQTVQQAQKVIFPGVGHAKPAMAYLKETGLDQVIVGLKQPVLGICLGQQLMCKHSEEGNTDCLNIFDATVKKFPSTNVVPHMGWNNLEYINHPLFDGLSPADDVYFVHSFYCEINANNLATCQYILPFSAVMQKDNFYAMQFHPEKSGSVGEKLLLNFLDKI